MTIVPLTAIAPAPPVAAAPSATDAAHALARPFVRALIRQMRAHDANGVWENKSDADLLAPFVLTREERRKIPAVADPDRRVIWRLEQFYNAISLSVESATGLMAAPIIKLSTEGYGRVVLIAGRLVVLSRPLRDVHRFGFESLQALAAEGEALTSEAVGLIEQFPQVARS